MTFKARSTTYRGIVERVNRKSVSVNAKPEGQPSIIATNWRVSPSLLTKLPKEEA